MGKCLPPPNRECTVETQSLQLCMVVHTWGTWRQRQVDLWSLRTARQASILPVSIYTALIYLNFEYCD